MTQYQQDATNECEMSQRFHNYQPLVGQCDTYGAFTSKYEELVIHQQVKVIFLFR